MSREHANENAREGGGVAEELRDKVAKAIADAIGHGMAEKCYAQADAAIAAMQAQQGAEPVAWMGTRETKKNGRVFELPCLTGNPAYVKAHPGYDWQPLYAGVPR